MTGNTTSAVGKFKFKDLKVHSTNEWLHGSQKKYRQVFNLMSVKYIYAELSIYNLMFAQEDWVLNVNFKIYDGLNALLCDKVISQPVPKTDDISYIRYSWGNQNPGTYWFKGAYRWE